MNGLLLALDAFHLLRPVWLLAFVPLVALWWHVRRTRVRRDGPVRALAPHLRAALTVGRSEQRRVHPIDGVAMGLALLCVGAAGPTWSREPDPFVSGSAPLVVALKVTPSMEANDIAPTRLERGKQKIRDLLEFRAGAQTALVAYAGSAHAVLPMTEDPSVMVPYLEGLSPDIMPKGGEDAGAALDLARSLHSAATEQGAVLFVADGLDPADAAAINAAGSPVAVLSMLPAGASDRGFDALDGSAIVAATPDGADVRQIDRMLDTAYRQALLDNTDQPWVDRGWWLAWPAALLMLVWFRKGWTMRWSVMVAVLLLAEPQAAQADRFADWFFTSDQQGQIALTRNHYAHAAELFVDPLRRGYALYRVGQYEDAIAVLDRVNTAEAAFIQGMAAIKSRSYRDGVRAFETALERDQAFPNAAENLAVAKEIVAYVERVREQSDTGEEQGIGADDAVFDNESGRGAATQIEAGEDEGEGLLTAQQWMNTVDTRTGDFLRQRFAIEAAQAAPLSATAQAPQ